VDPVTGRLAPDVRRPLVNSSASPHFVRLMATLTGADARLPRQAYAQRLATWLDWRHSMSVSGVLGAAVPAPAPHRPPAQAAEASARDAERVRTALVRLIDAMPPTAPDAAATLPISGNGARLRAVDAATSEFLPFRFHLNTVQQSMEVKIAALRERLRTALSAVSPEMAHLAALDAVMERVVGVHEQTQLATVGTWLEKHFERLRDAAVADDPPTDAARLSADVEADAGVVASPVLMQAASPPPATRASTTNWRDTYAEDMRALLLAELDLRLQPIQGLLAALQGDGQPPAPAGPDGPLPTKNSKTP